MHKMNRSLVAVVSWYNFQLLWLHRFLVSKTIKRKIINLLPKQGTPAVATLHIIPINNNSNLHYLQLLFRLVLQKTKVNISAKYLLLPLHIKSMRRDRCFRKKKLLLLYTKSMNKVDGSLCIGFVHEDSWKKNNDNIFPFIHLIIMNIDGHESFNHESPTTKNLKNEKILAVHEML